MLVTVEWFHLQKNFDNFSRMFLIHLRNITDFKDSLFTNVTNHFSNKKVSNITVYHFIHEKYFKFTSFKCCKFYALQNKHISFLTENIFDLCKKLVILLVFFSQGFWKISNKQT